MPNETKTRSIDETRPDLGLGSYGPNACMVLVNRYQRIHSVMQMLSDNRSLGMDTAHNAPLLAGFHELGENRQLIWS